MDSKPFFEFNMLEFEENEIDELKKFTKTKFSLDDILTTASSLKYINAIKKVFDREMENPSDAFVKLFASQIYGGRLTQPIVEQFSHIVKQGWKQFLTDNINLRLKSALKEPELDEITEKIEEKKAIEKPDDNGIITTEDETEGHNIVKAILSESLDVKRVVMRDVKSYCGILLDDNNRKPICRLHFNYSQKYLGVFENKKETRIPIDDVSDIFQYADKIKAIVIEYS
jgi:hypothetical protein